MFNRNQTRKVKVGEIVIGGGNRISVQSMTNTDTKNVSSTINQIKKLEDFGCEIVRVAVPDIESAKSLSKIKQKISIPLVADIHFDYR
ncbi:MAG: flavodoxin-dependent (E)-4-hydroxy-3-methylbut-2-enyl-diphosphate synthase, partial [Elusimicrobia bacterium]|nr:flavodoxin-dependent (E)-4-hydroxy-3-methylbut-2-enyl-diphosphate synthase [Elusimicrobiota bacterium]